MFGSNTITLDNFKANDNNVINHLLALAGTNNLHQLIGRDDVLNDYMIIGLLKDEGTTLTAGDPICPAGHDFELFFIALSKADYRVDVGNIAVNADPGLFEPGREIASLEAYDPGDFVLCHWKPNNTDTTANILGRGM